MLSQSNVSLEKVKRGGKAIGKKAERGRETYLANDREESEKLKQKEFDNIQIRYKRQDEDRIVQK